jgi:hypothetical protein
VILHIVPVMSRHGATFAIAIAIAVAIAGCGSAQSGGAAGQPLTPDDTGWVDRSTTGSTGIEGAWYTFADSENCLAAGHPAAACSLFVTPDPAAGVFAPTGDLGMCAVGVVAKVIAGPDGQPDWNNIWGAYIAFDLNHGGAYDAPAHGVTGLAFHIDAEPADGAEMRVQLATPATNLAPAVWGSATADTSPVRAGRNELRWADVRGPNYVLNPPPFDPTQLTSIAFGIMTDDQRARSFAFCISGLTALTD